MSMISPQGAPELPRVDPEVMRESPVTRALKGLGRANIQAQRRRILDAQILEIVRLRCATYHDCRMCSAFSTIDANLDDSIAAKIRRNDVGDFPEDWQVAVRLTDAVIMDPTLADEDLRAEARRHFDDEQISQILFGVMKWSCQKSLVALRTDIPPDEGTPIFYTDTGDPVTGDAAVAEYQNMAG